jgi:hypothetical protein
VVELVHDGHVEVGQVAQLGADRLGRLVRRASGGQAAQRRGDRLTLGDGELQLGGAVVERLRQSAALAEVADEADERRAARIGQGRDRDLDLELVSIAVEGADVGGDLEDRPVSGEG